MDTTFLLISLFFPRLALLGYYLDARIPSNTIPFMADVIASVFVPRILILLYIYSNIGADNGWFWAHLIAAILDYKGDSVIEIIGRLKVICQFKVF